MSRNAVREILLATMLFGPALAQPQPTYITFDVPGAIATVAQGVNAEGAVVGVYSDSAGKQHGFLLSGGSFTTIDYPGALSTSARGINSQGDIVGVHIDATGLPGGGNRGWLLQQGAFKDVNYPGHMNTIPIKITDRGVIVGCYHDTDTMGTMHGWMLDNGTFSDLSTPASMNNGVLPDGSMTAGLYTDMMTNTTHAYLQSGGKLASFDFPFSIATSAWDMNASGEVVGNYTDAAKKGHGFVLIPGEFDPTFGITPEAGVAPSYSFTSVDYPGAATTNALGVNHRGDVVGSYMDSAGKTHGFLLTRPRRRRA
jgi:probable HAF family extracellular repeat protein